MTFNLYMELVHTSWATGSDLFPMMACYESNGSFIHDAGRDSSGFPHLVFEPDDPSMGREEPLHLGLGALHPTDRFQLLVEDEA